MQSAELNNNVAGNMTLGMKPPSTPDASSTAMGMKVKAAANVTSYFKDIVRPIVDFFTPIVKRVIYLLQFWKSPEEKLKWMSDEQFKAFYQQKTQQPLNNSNDPNNKDLASSNAEFTPDDDKNKDLVAEKLRRLIVNENPALSRQQVNTLLNDKNLFNHFMDIESAILSSPKLTQEVDKSENASPNEESDDTQSHNKYITQLFTENFENCINEMMASIKRHINHQTPSEPVTSYMFQPLNISPQVFGK